MDEDVSNLGCGYEACCCREEVGGGEGGGLDSEGTEYQEGFFYGQCVRVGSGDRADEKGEKRGGDDGADFGTVIRFLI